MGVADAVLQQVKPRHIYCYRRIYYKSSGNLDRALLIQEQINKSKHSVTSFQLLIYSMKFYLLVLLVLL